jgi:hypothetical protein
MKLFGFAPLKGTVPFRSRGQRLAIRQCGVEFSAEWAGQRNGEKRRRRPGGSPRDSSTGFRTEEKKMGEKESAG